MLSLQAHGMFYTYTSQLECRIFTGNIKLYIDS